MKIIFLTIVLDGMPYINLHLESFSALPFDWEWHVIEGVAKPTHCTSWCKPIQPRLSLDGTTEYLDGIRSKQVIVHRKKEWDGKLEMVNSVSKYITEHCLLWQVDSDEIWKPNQIETVRQMFSQHPTKNAALFTCRYFVGEKIAVTKRGGYGNRNGEWLRVFRVSPGDMFKSHEPPAIAGMKMDPFRPEETEPMGLIFDHYAYALRSQVEFKEKYYGYKNAVACWEALNMNSMWPIKLKQFFHWVKDDSEVVLV